MAPGFIATSSPIKIYEDNEGAIAQSNNNIMNNASRTIALKFHFIREEIVSKRIELKSVMSQEQMADVLTKPLASPSFLRLRDQILGLAPWPTLQS